MATPMDKSIAALIPALKGKSKSLGMNGLGIDVVPHDIMHFATFLKKLSIKDNKLRELPREVLSLVLLEFLNLGHNEIETVPKDIAALERLETLYLFANKLTSISPDIRRLGNLAVLNLNNNMLVELPPELFSLPSLRVFSADNNRLKGISREICNAEKLTDLSFSGNQLSRLPDTITRLVNLVRLNLSDNRIRTLPDQMARMKKLAYLDVSLNKLVGFPFGLSRISLREFHFDRNPLIEGNNIVVVETEYEPLSLREMAARVLLEKCQLSADMDPNVLKVLARGRKCGLCGRPFVDTWLECARFTNLVKAQKAMEAKQKQKKLPPSQQRQIARKEREEEDALQEKERGEMLTGKMNTRNKIPLIVNLCSWNCFHSHQHSLLGIIHTSARPHTNMD